MTNEIQLKPCPFCGKEPEIEVFPLYKEGLVRSLSILRLRLVVKCSYCDYIFKTKDVGNCKWYDLENTKNKMIKQWNTRYTDND